MSDVRKATVCEIQVIEDMTPETVVELVRDAVDRALVDLRIELAEVRDRATESRTCPCWRCES